MFCTESPVSDLHSTMLLLYHKTVLKKEGTSSSFTFHYASTLSERAGCTKTDIQNLHSTMLLLYLSLIQPEHLLRKIYIPLCFYFIGFSALFFFLKILIYIPLCFYFIADAVDYANGKQQFTFHYASTLSNLPAELSHHIYRFTFHYASTLSTMMTGQ